VKKSEKTEYPIRASNQRGRARRVLVDGLPRAATFDELNPVYPDKDKTGLTVLRMVQAMHDWKIPDRGLELDETGRATPRQRPGLHVNAGNVLPCANNPAQQGPATSPVRSRGSPTPAGRWAGPGSTASTPRPR
jgi:hypothetical protein